MAEIFARFMVHEYNCPTRRWSAADPCGCPVEQLVVDAEFEVPDGATIAEAIMAARRAAFDEAKRVLGQS